MEKFAALATFYFLSGTTGTFSGPEYFGGSDRPATFLFLFAFCLILRILKNGPKIVGWQATQKLNFNNSIR